MAWTPDEEDIPIGMPENLRAIEEMDPDRLNAMTRQEVEDRLQEAAQSTASLYKSQVPKPSYDNCVLVVSTIFKKVGSDIGTHVGAVMVAESQSWAKTGCRSAFPDDPQ